MQKVLDFYAGVTLVEQTLSDGSKVYNVELPNYVIRCADKKSATEVYDMMVSDKVIGFN
jgi:hypothetical protein